MPSLGEMLVSLHDRLERHGIPHAFGGAIALAYCVGEPRGTADIDLNVFVPPSDASEIFRALPKGVRAGQAELIRAARDGQARVRWRDVPVDLFFSDHPFHDRVASRIRRVPFEGIEIPVLDCTDLVVFKALYGRSQDWVDIEAADDVAAVDRGEAMRWVAELLGAESPALGKLREVLSRPR